MAQVGEDHIQTSSSSRPVHISTCCGTGKITASGAEDVWTISEIYMDWSAMSASEQQATRQACEASAQQHSGYGNDRIICLNEYNRALFEGTCNGGNRAITVEDTWGNCDSKTDAGYPPTASLQVLGHYAVCVTFSSNWADKESDVRCSCPNEERIRNQNQSVGTCGEFGGTC